MTEHEIIARIEALRREYEKAIEPLVAKLVAIRSEQPPAPLMVDVSAAPHSSWRLIQTLTRGVRHYRNLYGEYPPRLHLTQDHVDSLRHFCHWYTGLPSVNKFMGVPIVITPSAASGPYFTTPTGWVVEIAE